VRGSQLAFIDPEFKSSKVKVTWLLSAPPVCTGLHLDGTA